MSYLNIPRDVVVNGTLTANNIVLIEDSVTNNVATSASAVSYAMVNGETIDLVNGNDEVISQINISDLVSSGIVQSASYNSSTQKIDIVFVTESGTQTVSVPLSSVIQIQNKLDFVSSGTNIGNVDNGSYSSVNSGRTNWIDTSNPGAAISLGGLQIALDNQGRLYSRKKSDQIWNITNQLKMTSETNLDNIIYPAVVKNATCTNAPTSNQKYTVFVITSADFDSEGYRAILQIAVNRTSHDIYVRSLLKGVSGSQTNLIKTDWKNLSSASDSIPVPPSIDGSYRLKATVTNGVTTYSWETDN